MLQNYHVLLHILADISLDPIMVYEYMAAHDLDRANELEDRLLPLIDACFTEVNPIPVKYGCNVIGLDAGLPRPPLTELEDAHKKIMDECIAKLGLKKV